MAIYVVGDIQGCLQPLKELLAMVDFSPSRDELWSVGDVVNRGPKSLGTLRFLHNLGTSFRMTLGNHDLHLLAVAAGVSKLRRQDTLHKILKAKDREELLGWLQLQPLLIRDRGYVVVHAGIPPNWDLDTAERLAAEVSSVLQNDATEYFKNMYGNKPNLWSDTLAGPERWRLITNYLTRMRFCDKKGRLELLTTGPAEQSPRGYAPWFSHRKRLTKNDKIIFGHWAALEGRDCGPNLYPLDTGCVWGGPLRLMCLSDNRYMETQSQTQKYECKTKQGK